MCKSGAAAALKRLPPLVEINAVIQRVKNLVLPVPESSANLKLALDIFLTVASCLNTIQELTKSTPNFFSKN